MLRPNLAPIDAALAPAPVSTSGNPADIERGPGRVPAESVGDSAWPIPLEMLASGAGLGSEIAEHFVARNAEIILAELRAAENGLADSLHRPDRILRCIP